MHLEITKLLDESSNPLIKFKNLISSQQNFIIKDQSPINFAFIISQVISYYTGVTNYENNLKICKLNIHLKYNYLYCIKKFVAFKNAN